MNKHDYDYQSAVNPPTIRKGASNRQAPEQTHERKELLFAALEDYANLPPGLEAFRNFRTKWQNFFPLPLYEASEMMEGERKPSPLGWCLRQLHAVWNGEDRAAARISVLLGFDTIPRTVWLADPALEPERLAWVAIQDELRKRNFVGSPCRNTIAQGQRLMEKAGEGLDVGLGLADVGPDWKLGIIRCKFDSDFQEALYALMLESWRAKTCRNCGKYFIAGKPPQMYCSPRCFGEAKGKRSLKWWRAEGSDRRERRRRMERVTKNRSPKRRKQDNQR